MLFQDSVSACDEFCSICTKVWSCKKKKFSMIFLIWIFFFKIWSWKSKLRSPFWVKKNVTVILKTWKWHLLSGPDTLCVDVTVLDTYFIFLQVILFEIDETYFQRSQNVMAECCELTVCVVYEIVLWLCTYKMWTSNDKSIVTFWFN